MRTDELLLAEYRARRSPETLLALLEAQQDAIYNVCHQVLRCREDAEDAAQEVLLKLAGGIDRLTDAEHVRRWSCRASLNASLDLLRKRRRARAGLEERRIADMVDAGPEPDERHERLHESLSSLDGDLQALVVRHFFEQRTLEELAREEGCSTAAVWKRIEKAKDLLKRALVAGSVAGGAVAVDAFLANRVPVRAPAGLISEAIRAKAGLAAAGSGIGTAAAIGGTVMAVKSGLTATTAIVGLVLFGAGITGGWMLRPAPPADDSGRKLAVATPVPASTPGAFPAPDSGKDEEIARLRARIQELESRPAAPPAADKSESAAEFYDQVLAILKDKQTNRRPSPEALKVIGRLPDLRPEMASYFIDRFMKAQGGEEIEAGAMMTLFAGGRDVAELLKRALADPGSASPMHWERLAGAAGGQGLTVGLSRVTIDQDLADEAFRNAGSTEQTRQELSAVILGRVPTPQSRATLRGMVDGDRLDSVRAAALSALVLVGDQETLSWLRGLPAPSWEHDPEFAHTLPGAIAALEARLGK